MGLVLCGGEVTGGLRFSASRRERVVKNAADGLGAPDIFDLLGDPTIQALQLIRHQPNQNRRSVSARPPSFFAFFDIAY
jgi:hypothetical protein